MVGKQYPAWWIAGPGDQNAAVFWSGRRLGNMPRLPPAPPSWLLCCGR